MMAAVAAAPAAGQGFVTTNGQSFEVCSQPFRFVGFHVRGLCHFGQGDALPFSSTADIAANLDYCTSAEARVTRVFCAYHGINAVETGHRLQTILDACAQRGMYVIVALTDMYINSGMYPQGDGAYYTNYGSYTMLNHNFFAGGYTDNYLPQALYLADRFRDHPAVFAWQLGNEIRDLSSGSTFVTFCQTVAAQIRAADPNHMISTGVIGWRQSNISYSQALQIYNSMDFVNTHNYHGSDYDNDSDVANQLNLPYVIDEAGFDSNVYGPDRTPETNADIAKWFNRGVDGYVQWGLMATNYDNGDGDRVVGVDLVFHATDFWLYRDLFNTWGTSLQIPVGLTVEPAMISQTVGAGQSPADDTFDVIISGGGSVSFTVNESLSWASVLPSVGQADCSGTPVTIQYNASGLGSGTHVGMIEITAPGVPNSPQVIQVSLTLEGTPGDFDGDGDVDQEDFGAFQACLSGPGTPQPLPACAPARFDPDPDVDQDDFALFQACISGPNMPADPQCAS